MPIAARATIRQQPNKLKDLIEEEKKAAVAVRRNTMRKSVIPVDAKMQKLLAKVPMAPKFSKENDNNNLPQDKVIQSARPITAN